MRTRWLGLALLAFVAFAMSLAACGGGEEEGGGGGTAAGGGPIPIGFIAPLSEPGDFRSGKSNLQAARLWVDQVNKNGGILGRKVKLETGDDQGAPETGASEATRLISAKKVVALVGMWNSSTTLAQIEVARRFNVPIFSHYSWADDITAKNYDQVFRIGPYNSLISKLMVPYLRDKGYSRVAVLAEDTDYGIGQAEALKEAATGNPEVDIVQFQAQTKDVTPELSKLAANPPDAVIIASAYEAENLAFNQAQEVGLKSDMIAGWDYPTLPGFWDVVGKNGVGVVYPTFYDESLALTNTGKGLKAAFNEATGQDPVVYHYLLWDCMNAVKWAIEQSKSTDPAKIVETLPDADFEGSAGPITFTNEKGTVNYHQWLGITEFFKEFTAVGQTDADAKLVFTSRQEDLD